MPDTRPSSCLQGVAGPDVHHHSRPVLMPGPDLLLGLPPAQAHRARLPPADRQHRRQRHGRSRPLPQIHVAQTRPATCHGDSPTATRESLRAYFAAQERAARQAARVSQFDRKLSELLGQQAWRESGLGAPADIDTLNQKITHLEQRVAVGPATRTERPGRPSRPRRQPRADDPAQRHQHSTTPLTTCTTTVAHVQRAKPSSRKGCNKSCPICTPGEPPARRPRTHPAHRARSELLRSNAGLANGCGQTQSGPVQLDNHAQ